MTGKQAWFGCIMLLATFSMSSQGREIWDEGVPEPYFQHFLNFYKADPSALSRWAAGLRNISTDQLDRTLAALDTTQFTYLYPQEIKGFELAAHLGVPIDEYSLMAVREGKLIAIPFQIDEFDKSGLIWIDGHNEHPAEGKPGIFDDFDELVFMFRDGGWERYDANVHTLEEGTLVEEIRLDSPQNQARYVYLVRNNTERSRADYVHVDLEEGRIETTLMETDYDPQDFTRIESMSPRLGPHKGVNVFDNVFVNISTGILNEKLRVNLNTRNNIKATPIAVNDGVVRASILVKARIWYAYMPTFFSQKFQIDFYEQSVTIPSRFAIGSVRVLKFFLKFLREPRIHFSVDFNNLEGARVTFETVHDKGEYGTVDGEMSDFETRMNQTRLPGDWLNMDSNQGWEMFFSNHLPVVPNGLFDDFLTGIEMHMFYEDDPDSTTKHERYPGANPRIGFESEGLPRTLIDLMGAVPKLNYLDMHSLGEGIVALADASEKGALDKYDRIVNERLSELREAGRYTTVEELADAFVADLDRMRFSGIPRDTFNQLIRQAMLDTVEQSDQVKHGKVLQRMIELAKEQGIDIRQLRYATMDNTLWFPAWTGENGPTAFHQEVTQPPSPVMLGKPAPPSIDATLGNP